MRWINSLEHYWSFDWLFFRIAISRPEGDFDFKKDQKTRNGIFWGGGQCPTRYSSESFSVNYTTGSFSRSSVLGRTQKCAKNFSTRRRLQLSCLGANRANTAGLRRVRLTMGMERSPCHLWKLSSMSRRWHLPPSSVQGFMRTVQFRLSSLKLSKM